MLITTMYVWSYTSFDDDYLRKHKLNRESGEHWDAAPGSDQFHPFVRGEMNRDITTAEGANEADKSQLIGAAKRLLTGEKIVANDLTVPPPESAPIDHLVANDIDKKTLRSYKVAAHECADLEERRRALVESLDFTRRHLGLA